MTDPDREDRVSRAFVALADSLVDDYDIIDLLDQLTAHCVSLLAADSAGVLLGDARRELRVVASSSEDAQTMDLLQLQSDQGPCLDSYQSLTQVRIPDLADAADRWPAFVTMVERHGGYRSVHAIPLRLRGQAIGALNLFHRNPGALPEPDLALAQALADVATIGILSERSIRHGEVLAEQLQTALNSRVVIEQAKGVIAHSLGIAVDTAFERLRRYSRTNNRRLAEVAREIIDGRLPASDLRPTGDTDRQSR